MKYSTSLRNIVGSLLLVGAVTACTPDKETPPAASAEAPPATAPAAPAPVVELTPADTLSAARMSLTPAEGGKVSGTIQLYSEPTGVQLRGVIMGLGANSQQAFHIHEKGDCSAADFSSAGGHFNPAGHEHGKPDGGSHHAGDMLNLSADANGMANVDVLVPGINLGSGDANDVMDRSIVVHAAADDYTSQPAGNSGARVACGVIRK